jgi:CO/xanthine dehydrogenase FAD-binding subunit
MRILHDFEYERPPDLHAALELLSRYGDRARPIAGGTDVVIGLKYRSMLQLADPDVFPAASRAPKLMRPDVVVSLADLADLRGIAVEGDTVRVGARTTMTEIADSDHLPPALAALADAAGAMGSPLIRNRATIGGNLAHARPAADTAVATVTVGARYELASLEGRRWVEAPDFFTGPGETVKRPHELLTAVEMRHGRGQGSAYLRQGTRRQLEIALASAAAWVELDERTGQVTAARIGLGAVGPTPLLAPAAAKVLVGKRPDAETTLAAATAARSETKPIDDYRGSAAYRLELVEVLVRRAIEIAVSRARGEGGRR